MTDLRLPELLCPAGDEAALRAAVDCGANAVYLGYKAYGARASASNFDEEGLVKAVAYAHLYHARVHVTVNTLVKENEFAGVTQALQAIVQAGADAVIVQDLGVAALVRDHFPALELHASTQMALSNASDALWAKGFGYDRVVLARECMLKDIAAVVQTGIETEVFVHGALCSSVSGRCLMSSMAGGRSSNRGRCAQPCRLQTTVGGYTGALLSLRDLCTLPYLPELCAAGVSSLKVEGRLKSPEYVAVVTEVYRQALDEIAAGVFDPESPKPMEALLQVFNRGGFTKGHAFGAEDAELCATERVSHAGLPLGKILSVRGQFAVLQADRALNDGDSLQLRGDRDYELRYSGHDVPTGETATLRLREDIHIRSGCAVSRLNDARQLEAARRHKPALIPVIMSACFKQGRPMELSVSDGQTDVTVLGEAVQPAAKCAANEDDVRRQLSKLGDSPFALQAPEALSVTLGENCFLPVSALNALRRAAVDKLIAARLAAFVKVPIDKRKGRGSTASASPACGAIGPHTLAVCFSNPAQGQPLLDSGAELLLYQPGDLRFDPLSAALQALPTGAWLQLPPQMTESTLQAVKAVVADFQSHLGGICAASYGQLTMDWQLPVIAGGGIPISNKAALQALAQTPAQAFTLWPEWTAAEQRELLPFSLPALMTIYGRETLMLLNHCPARVKLGLAAQRSQCRMCGSPTMACGQENALLRDQKGYEFPLRRTVFPEGCILSVLNALPTDLRAFHDDRLALGAGMLLCFTTETSEEQQDLTRLFAALQRGEAVPSAEQKTTAGHWKRSVE